MRSALKVMSGVNEQNSTNSASVDKFKNIKRKKLTSEEYVNGIISGNITILSKAITLIESSKTEHQEIAQQIIENALPYASKSIRIGITGIPGAGKSTFIESLGMYLTKQGHKLAVLAIDPSSEKTKGSILGDKTRMEKLSASSKAFIRPSPSSGTLGGVARKTRETIVLCEAAGFDTIFIETVGVGQSETAVYSMVDFFLLLMLAGAGDELQGIKRGIMEMADTIVITKCDGDNINNAQRAQAEYKNAVHLFPKSLSGWDTRVLTCSARNNAGISEIWENILEYQKLTRSNNFFFKKRAEQSKYWMYETINERLRDSFYHNASIKNTIQEIEQEVLDNKITPFIAAKKLFEMYKQP